MTIFAWPTTPLICFIQNWSLGGKVKPVQNNLLALIKEKSFVMVHLDP